MFLPLPFFLRDTLTDEVSHDSMGFRKVVLAMSIAGDLIRGHTDAIILARLLQSDSYGYEINKTISTMTGGKFELKEATLYTAFKRLEEQDYIRSYWGNQGSGARRRYNSITPEGRKACHRLQLEWLETRQIMDHLLEGKDSL